MRPLHDKVIRTFPVKKELEVRTDLKTAKDEVLNSLNASGYRTFEATEENSVQLYTQKGKYSRLGLYTVHLSIFLIFVGAIISAYFAINGHVMLPEGRSTSLVTVRTGTLQPAEKDEKDAIIYYLDKVQGDVSLLSQKMGIDEEVLNARMKRYGIKPLGFTIKCNWFNIKYYEHGKSIKESNEFMTPLKYESELVIFDGGKEIMTKVIQVNNPLTYKGMSFYQSSFGMFDDPAAGVFVLKVTPYEGRESTLRVRPGGTFEIAGTGIKGNIIDFHPALYWDKDESLLYYLNVKDKLVSPGLNIKFNKDGKDFLTTWSIKRFPETWVIPGGHKIEFVDYDGIEYTVLQFAKDPGTGVIYLACIIMTLGLYIAFFMSHRKIWVCLTNEKGLVRITIGGSASKNKFSFEKDVEGIMSRASQAIEGRSKK